MDNKCVKCGESGVIVEAAPDGKTKKIKCLKCGYLVVEDARGKPLLTEVPFQPSGRQFLVEG